MLREGMFIAERYEVLEKIGSGGMSDVYKAKCHKLNRFVAIKVLKPEFSEDKTFVSKFRAEAQSAAGLMHANIVNVYDVGEENGIYYIVMELVEGITLKKYIERKGKLGVREAVSIAIQVAQGMEAAHKHRIVHRDIKPQNIIISKEGKVKVTDFGIARAASSNTINSTVMGSVHYISPEQARGGYSDEKSDIYSFGIMLFEMLTGKVPFEGDTTVAIALQHIQDDIVSPKEYVPEIPISVEKIVLKCTQKKTEKRYQNATDLIADLKRSLVTPDEDFVVIASAVAIDAPTQLIDEDDMAEISKKAGQKSMGIDVISPSHEGLDKKTFEEDVVEEDIQTEAVTDEEDDEDEEDTDIAASRKIDKVIAIMGIAVGAIIIIITIIVIIKTVNLFSDKKSTNNTASNTTTEADDGLVEVPLVIGYDYDYAKEVLNKAGLGIKDTYDYSSEYEEGLIFNQSVKSGERVEPNTSIIVTISKGAATFDLPNVLGSTQSSAETTLKQKDLKVSYQYEDTQDESLWGTVKNSDPEAGTSVQSGDVITLVIYKGPDVVSQVVPDVAGSTLDAAKKQLNDLGFDNITCEYENDKNVAKGNVISLSGAEVGESVPVTTHITLVISNGPENVTAKVPTVTGKTLSDAKSLLSSAGFTKVEEEEEYSDSVEAGNIISISGANEGDKISVDTVITLVVSKGAEETSTVQSASIKESIGSGDIDSLFDGKTIDKNQKIKLTFYALYNESDGTNINKQISAVTCDNYNKMLSKGTFNLNETVENVSAGDAVTIKIVVEYFETADATETVQVETSKETTFQ